MNTQKHTNGQKVAAVKEGIHILGKITAVLPEMQYEIEDKNGLLRTVDHAHILDLKGYLIDWNEIFGGYDLNHPEIGFCGHVNTLEEAIDYCDRG